MEINMEKSQTTYQLNENELNEISGGLFCGPKCRFAASVGSAFGVTGAAAGLYTYYRYFR
jgi:bacteriocin-like protein